MYYIYYLFVKWCWVFWELVCKMMLQVVPNIKINNLKVEFQERCTLLVESSKPCAGTVNGSAACDSWPLFLQPDLGKLLNSRRPELWPLWFNNALNRGFPLWPLHIFQAHYTVIQANDHQGARYLPVLARSWTHAALEQELSEACSSAEQF